MPFLHPAFVLRVLRAVREGADVGLPVARGDPQPLAAAYRTALAPVAERLVQAGRLRPAFLFEECVVSWLDEAALRDDPVLAVLDPGLDSVVNINEPGEYRTARSQPAPEITVQRFGVLANGHRAPEMVRAATVAQAAAAAGVEFGGHVTAALNGDQITRDGRRRWRRGIPSSSCRPARSAGSRRHQKRPCDPSFAGDRRHRGDRRCRGGGGECGPHLGDREGEP